jgi:AraC-like DNA-binding protein
MLSLIVDFLQFCTVRNVAEGYVADNQSQQFKLARVENHLVNNLCGKFPGIEFLADQYGLSPTALKIEFKRQFGKPVYQYFQARQMALTRILLQEQEIRIKELAYMLGYESLGKFSAAFAKHHGVLPSELDSRPSQDL